MKFEDLSLLGSSLFCFPLTVSLALGLAFGTPFLDPLTGGLSIVRTSSSQSDFEVEGLGIAVDSTSTKLSPSSVSALLTAFDSKERCFLVLVCLLQFEALI